MASIRLGFAALTLFALAIVATVSLVSIVRGFGGGIEATRYENPDGPELITICHVTPDTLAHAETLNLPESDALGHLDDHELDSIGGCTDPVVDGSVRDGLGVLKNGSPDDVSSNLVQLVDVPNFEDRGVVEFFIGGESGTVDTATLHLTVLSANGPYPFTIDVFGYIGDGVLGLDDWSAGSLITTLVYSGQADVTVDVAAFLGPLIASAESIAGFRFDFAVPSSINLNGPFVAFSTTENPPAATLWIQTH